MFNIFIYYILNIFPDILKLYKRLDIIIRQIVKNKLIEAIRLNIKSVVLKIKIFIKNCENIIALISFTLINLLIDYADYLNLFLETRFLIRLDIFL
jgi:hypothetical protein